MNNFERVESYINYAIGIANDNQHGYSQINRNGNPDYDCSSLVISALRSAGFPMSGASYTGDMYKALINDGFELVSRPYKRGDIFLSHNDRKQHTAIYIGDNKIVHARGVKGHPESGDQSGDEIAITNVTCFAPDFVFRYPIMKEVKLMKYVEVLMPVIRRGDKCFAVGVLQTLLNQQCGYYLVVDNDFGMKTEQAVINFQKSKFNNPNDHDGIVGVMTWGRLLNGLSNDKK